MVKYCCVCKTEKGTVSNISFYGIPKKEEVKAKWIINIGQEVSKNSLVCSRHFNEKDYYFKLVGDTVKRMLVPTAIPSSALKINRDDSKQTLNNATDSISKQISCIGKKINEANNHNKIHVDTGDSLQPSTSQHLEYYDNDEIIEQEDSFTLSDDRKDDMLNDSQYSNCNDSQTPIRQLDEPCKHKKHPSNPHDVEDLRREHFTSEISWRIVNKYIHNSKKKQKALNERVKCLNNELKTLKSIVNYVKSLKRNTLEVNS